MSDIIMNPTATNARSAKGYPLLSADQMRPLLDAVGEAVKNYSEDDEDRTGDAVIRAQERIANARTVDPLAIAYKLRATRHWRDPAKGLAEDLESPDLTARTIATLIRDIEAAAAKPARPVPSRLRPLWDAYQKAWKHTCDVMDEEDAAMVARPKDVEPGSTEAELAAKAKRKLADQAFNAASEALQGAPTKTFDDALCRIEWAIEESDETVDSEIIAALSDALRVLRKVNASTSN